MFVYNTGDIVGCLLIGLLILAFIYKIARYQYLKFKFRKCPKCGSKTSHYTDTEHFIGEINSYEKFYCGKLNCDWEEKLYF